jgi:protein-S-isoprenylcysteine O-methyltransferase Ste14
MRVILGIGAVLILTKAGLPWVAAVLGVGIILGLRAGRAWGFNQLGAFERTERMRRARSRQGGWGIF